MEEIVLVKPICSSHMNRHNTKLHSP